MLHIIKVPAARREEKIEFEALPVASREFVINYGLRQLLNDSIVSGKDDESRNELLDRKLAKLYEGTLAVREGGARGNPVEREMRAIAQDLANQFFRKTGAKLKSVSDDDMSAKVAEFMALPKVRTVAEANVAAVAANKALLED